MARRLIVAVVLVLALAGCGGDPKADPSPTKSTSTVSTTPSPSATAPAMPDAAKANTKAGAIAFVRYYIDVQNFATGTGDTQTLRKLVLATCSECIAVPNFVEKVYGAGGHIDGDGWELLAIAPVTNAPGPTDMDYIDVKIRVNEQTVYTSPSASPSAYAGDARRDLSIGLTRTGSTWQISRIIVGRA